MLFGTTHRNDAHYDYQTYNCHSSLVSFFIKVLYHFQIFECLRIIKFIFPNNHAPLQMVPSLGLPKVN